MYSLVSYIPLAGVEYAYTQSNLAGKVIVGLLFVGSIFVWSIMVTKIRELLIAHGASERFLAAYRKDPSPTAVFLDRKKKRFEACPLYTVYDAACVALGGSLERAGVVPAGAGVTAVAPAGAHLDQREIASVQSMAERTMADQALLLENSMGLLAIATPTAPFLGLLGTVWGVMDSFGGMAVTGTAMLSAVAPGISGALLTTVVGLLVALPSAIGYNVLSEQVRRLCVKMENFSQEFVSDIQRHYG